MSRASTRSPVWFWAPFALVVSFAAPGAEPTPAELATRYSCSGCHAPATRLVGPSYKEIAARYVSKADARTQLRKSIHMGSQGVWGPMAMPPMGAVPDEHVNVLVDWILAVPAQ